MVGERTAAARMPVQARYPLISCSVGVSADIQLDSTAATSAPDPTEDVASQRCKYVAEDAEKRIAAMYATDALTRWIGHGIKPSKHPLPREQVAELFDAPKRKVPL